MADREPQPEDGPEYHEDHAAWVLRNHTHDYKYVFSASKEPTHIHDFKYEGDDYGSLGGGGSYEIYRCTICRKSHYSPLPD
jgi:hypothetical protein